MTSKCNKCGIDIEWRKEDGRNVPYTLAGSKHSYKECPKADNKSKTSEGERKPVNKQTRWESIKKVEEIKLRQVNEYLLNGWVILDRVERVVFVPQGNELKEGSESVYVVGQRA